MKKWIAALLAVMILGGLCSVAMASEGEYEAFLMQSGEIHSQGQAVRTAVPDTATIRVGANVEAKDERTAQADANAIVNTVIESLTALGIEPAQMKTTGYTVAQKRSPKTPFVTGSTTSPVYVASISLTVTIKDFDLINAVLDKAAEAGANVVNGLSFSCSNEGEIYRQALEDAVIAAREKAELMANACGVELHSLLRLTEGGRPSVYYNSYGAADMMAESEYDSGAQIMAGETEISANVTLIYRTK